MASRESPETPVQAQVDAYNAHDVDAFCACYHADVEVFEFPATQKFHGMDAFRKVYAALFERAPSLRVRIRNRVVHGRWVVDEEDVAGMPGKKSMHAVALYEVEAGLIRRVWFLPSP